MEAQQTQHQSHREVYLDYAAATPLDARVQRAMQPYYAELFFNPSAPYAPARRAHAALDYAKARLARILGTRADNITLTAGATEANNLAFACTKAHVVSCAIEHESVLACAQAHGAAIVAVDASGLVDPLAVAEAVTPETELVSIALANGELGTVQPLRRIAQALDGERLRRLKARDPRPLLLHTDASQAAGQVSLNVSTLGVDLMTLSAAKIYGPKQVGLLWHADGVALRPLVRGGGQEQGLRSGTENVAGVVGFARALELSETLRRDEARRLRDLSLKLRKRIAELVPDAVFSGPTNPKGRLPGLVHVSFAGVEARRLVVALERRGVYVGTGSACAASRMRISPVLVAIGMPEELAAGSLRLSLGRDTTEEDIDYAASAIAACVEQERARTARKDG